MMKLTVNRLALDLRKGGHLVLFLCVDYMWSFTTSSWTFVDAVVVQRIRYFDWVASRISQRDASAFVCDIPPYSCGLHLPGALKTILYCVASYRNWGSML